MVDCLIIGFNDSSFESYVKMVASIGTNDGAYRDLRLAFIDYEGKPQRSLDILNHFYGMNHPGHKPFHNADFLWPVVTCLGTYLWRHGLSFDYVNLFHMQQEELKEKLAREDILTIAVTTTLYVSVYPILEIVEFVRKYNRTAKIVVGGPYIANQSSVSSQLADIAPAGTSEQEVKLERLFKYIDADFYVINSEGEYALVNLIRALKDSSPLGDVDNIAYKDGDSYIFTKRSVERAHLAENMIEYSLFPRESFGQFVTTRTAKSCPFSCAFCGFPQRAGKYTYLDVDLVERELNAINEIGAVNTVTFIDDTFNVPKDRFRQILRMMIRNKYSFKWNAFYRSDHGDDETIDLMGQAGCEGVFLGVESGSDTMLQKMNKAARRKDYSRAIPRLRAAGISTYASLIIGFPGETYETVKETIDFLRESQPEFYRAQLWYCEPITPIWSQRDQYEIKGVGFKWTHKTMDASAACDLIDMMFLSIDESLWMPQFGFEQWSIFYLQRRGMSIDQIKTFVSCFNAVIRRQLLYPWSKSVDPPLMENLRISCQFDGPEIPSNEGWERFSGAAYRAAERFWVETLSGDFQTVSILEGLLKPRASGDGAGTILAGRPSRSTPSSLGAAFEGQTAEALFAVFGVALLRLSDRDSVLITASIEKETEAGADWLSSPVHLRSAPDTGFRRFMSDLCGELARAKAHQQFVYQIVANRHLMEFNGLRPPILDVGYRYRDAGRTKNEEESGFISHPALDEVTALILDVSCRDGEVEIQWLYDPSRLGAGDVENLDRVLSEVIASVSSEPDIFLSRIITQSHPVGIDSTVEFQAGESFHF